MRKVFFSLLFFAVLTSKAQDKVVVDEAVIWYYASEKIVWSEKWSTSLMFQYRDFLDRTDGYHIFFTGNLAYKLSDQWTIGAGFTNLNINRPADGEIVLVPELRPIQFVQLAQPLGKGKFSWRFMVEQRFFRNAANGELIDGTTFNWRYRNKAQLMYPLFKIGEGTMNGEISTEVMFHSGENIDLNVFDQHRLIGQLHYKIGSFTISSGYMHWFFQTATGVDQQNRHTWLIGLSHTLKVK